MTHATSRGGSGTCVNLRVERYVISMMVMCNDIIITEHDGRKPGLRNVPVVTEHDNDRTEIKSSKHTT